MRDLAQSTMPRHLGRLAAAGLLLLAAACAPQRPETPVSAASTAPEPVAEVEGPVRVALLVPLGSANETRAAIGRSLANAAQLAARDIAGAEVIVDVYATAGDPARGARVAGEALAAGADIFVGPLFGEVAQAVAPIAAQRGVQVLSFSTNPAIAGGNLFISGTTLESRAGRAIAHASTQGLTRIGILHPQDATGQAARAAVERVAPRTGASVVAVASYPRSTNGITEAAPGYVAALRDAGSQAVVMSDGGSGLLFAASFLPINGLSPRQVQLIGLRDLDRAAILADATLQGMWFPAPDPGPYETFRARYSGTYGEMPHPLASIAYDTVAAVGALARDARQSGDRTPFSRANLTQPQGFAGVTGVFRYMPNGQNERALAILAVNRGGVTLVAPAPRSFVRPGS
ncbi:MAG: penicillin-binding protein activator [Pseudomonadota bacterium]